ncbi:MAG TPA: hypothetical protein VF407_04240 [Polyangiaceae bacterium]
MARPVVAFLTSAEHAHLTADDRLAADALAAHGVDVVPWVWTATSHARDARASQTAAADAPACDLIVIRSPWDWTADPAGWDRMLARLEAGPIPLENRAARHFQDKVYLEDLAAKGARVAPSRFVRDLAAYDDVLARTGWHDVVAKPSLSAGGRKQLRFDPRAADHSHRDFAADVLRTGLLLIQPFFRAIVDQGEWSLVFFDGEYSHALKKHPAAGDYRVQDDWGGTVAPAIAPPELVADARKVLEASGESFLYARVDGFESRDLGGFVCTELEVVEPELFFRTDPQAPERFAAAVVRRLARTRR